MNVNTLIKNKPIEWIISIANKEIKEKRNLLSASLPLAGRTRIHAPMCLLIYSIEKGKKKTATATC